ALGKDIENRIETIGEQLETIVDHFVGDGWKAVKQVPDGAAGEAVDDADAKAFSGASGFFQLLGGPLIDGVGLAVAPDVRREDGLMALVDLVAHGLADKMGADGVALQLVGVQKIALAATVSIVR